MRHRKKQQERESPHERRSRETMEFEPELAAWSLRLEASDWRPFFLTSWYQRLSWI